MTIAAWMQPLQYDLQSSAAKDNSIAHAAAAPSNLDAAITMRSAEIELQNAIELRAAVSEIAAPKPDGSRRQSRKKTILKHFSKGILKGKLLAPKVRKSADKSLSQPGWSHPNTIYNLQLQKTIVLRMQPRHQATLTQPLPCVSQHHVANLHVSTQITTPDDKSHAAIPMRSASTDSKRPYNYAHTSTPKAAWSHRYNAAKKKRQTDPSRNRRTDEVPFIVACSHITRKNTRFRAPASSPKHSPCNIMQPLQCGSQHQLANLHLSTHRTTPEHQMTRVMQPFQCDLQAQIPKHPITTHTQAHPKQLEATVTMRQKKNDKPTPAATAAQTRYLSSSPAATLHGKTQGFVLQLPPQNIAHATSCSHFNAVRSINSQTCTYLRTERHQNTRWQESCSHSNSNCKHRFQNIL